jgi:hypothetical protein
MPIPSASTGQCPIAHPGHGRTRLCYADSAQNGFVPVLVVRAEYPTRRRAENRGGPRSRLNALRAKRPMLFLRGSSRFSVLLRVIECRSHPPAPANALLRTLGMGEHVSPRRQCAKWVGACAGDESRISNAEEGGEPRRAAEQTERATREAPYAFSPWCSVVLGVLRVESLALLPQTLAQPITPSSSASAKCDRPDRQPATSCV